jgi:GntR family transcriptional regulator
MVHLDYRDARPIYTQILENFRSQIAAGILQPGDKLPSVRELAAQLTINPNTIQRAYREMEQQGMIQTLPGKGCFVCHVSAAPDWEKLDNAVAQLLSQDISREEILKRIGGKEP